MKIECIECHDKYSCNICKGKNEITVMFKVKNIIYECGTRCKSCGYEDWWAYGFFNETKTGIDKCRKVMMKRFI